jgi:transketolase
MNGDLPAGLDGGHADYKKQLAEIRRPWRPARRPRWRARGHQPGRSGNLGGSADLTGSNNTRTSQTPITPDDFSGRYIHYGIREHGMAAP